MTEKSRIEIALLLPAVPEARDAFVQRLGDLLRANEGIEAAHLPDVNDKEVGQICIHYDPDRLSIGDVRDLARRAGAELEKRFGHLLLKTEPMHARQARTAESRARQITGELEAAASPVGMLRIEFDRQVADEAAIRAALQKIGVRILEVQKKRTQAEPSEAERTPAGKEHEHAHGGLFGERTELVFAALCGGLLLIGWLLSVLTDITPWVPWSLYLAAYLFGGLFMFRDAIEDIRVGRFDIDFLMLVAAVGAATLGEWAEGALLLFLFSLGHALEHFAMGRAKRAIKALAELAPQTALVRREGNTEELPVEQLLAGDVVIVKPNERLPADGFVIKEEGSVNQAPITGAMGAAGSDVALETTDVALETADVALMADDLNHLPFVVGLSRQTSRIIRQNLWFSLGMVAFRVPASIFGLRLGTAVALHEVSTLLVVLNALRLLAYQAIPASTITPSDGRSGFF